MPTPAMPHVHSVTRVLRNTIALAAGRNLIALSRLAVLAVLARGLGTDVFGQYALLIALLMIAEGLLDFGSNETFVRDVTRFPDRRTHLLRVMTAGRLLHAPLAWALLVVTALVLGYERDVVEAAVIGGMSLVFLGGVMVYRVSFRTDLTMEREIAAEFISVMVMLGGILLVARREGGIFEVMACHVAARAVYFAAAQWFGRREFRLSVIGVTRADLKHGWVACSTIGAAGFLVMTYDAIDVILLSRLGSFDDTAKFAAAQRLAWPLLMTLSAVGGTLYSVVSSAWPHDVPRLERACQRGFDTVVLFGLAAVCAGIAGAEFLLSLIGSQVAAGAPAFGVLIVLCVVKSISSTVGPALLVVGAQRVVLLLIANALVFKFVAGAMVIPRFGFVGLAWSALAVETLLVALPALVLVSRRAGIRLRYFTALRAVLCCVIATTLTRHWLGTHGVLPVLIAPSLYLALLILTGTVRPADLKRLRESEEAA